MGVYRSTASFIRPDNTTAYADNDLIANHATAGSVVPMKFHQERGGKLIARTYGRR